MLTCATTTIGERFAYWCGVFEGVRLCLTVEGIALVVIILAKTL